MGAIVLGYIAGSAVTLLCVIWFVGRRENDEQEHARSIRGRRGEHRG